MSSGAVLLTLLAGPGCGDSRGIEVSAAEYGERWPFTIAVGTLRCDVNGQRKAVRLDTGTGIQYGINGAAKTLGFPDSAAVHKPGVVGVDLQPLIERGLTLCDARR